MTERICPRCQSEFEAPPRYNRVVCADCWLFEESKSDCPSCGLPRAPRSEVRGAFFRVLCEACGRSRRRDSNWSARQTYRAHTHEIQERAPSEQTERARAVLPTSEDGSYDGKGTYRMGRRLGRKP